MGRWAEGRRCSADDARALAIAFADAMTSSPTGTISVPYPTLSRREREILQLVAAGQTNRQIADALFISVPTVKRHLTTVYGKLGVDSRVEAAALFGKGRLGLIPEITTGRIAWAGSDCDPEVDARDLPSPEDRMNAPTTRQPIFSKERTT